MVQMRAADVLSGGWAVSLTGLGGSWVGEGRVRAGRGLTLAGGRNGTVARASSPDV